MASTTIDYWKRPRLVDAYLLGEDHLADLLHGYFSTEYGDKDATNVSRSPMHDRWMDWCPLNEYEDTFQDHSLIRNDSHSVRRACKRNRLDFHSVCGVIHWYFCNAGHRNQYAVLVKKQRYDLLEVKFLFEQEIVRESFAAERDYGDNVKRRDQATDIRRWFEAAGTTHYAWMFSAAYYAEVFSTMPENPRRRRAVKYVEYLEGNFKPLRAARALPRNHVRRLIEVTGGGPAQGTELHGITLECSNRPVDDSDPPPPYAGPSSPEDTQRRLKR